MDQADSEQLVVGQDARDKRKRLLKWLSIGLAVLAVIVISVAIAYPLTKRPQGTRFEVPTTVVIDDTRAHLVFGEGRGNMVTEAIIEVASEVDHVTVHIDEFSVSDRADYDNKDKIYDPVVKFDNIESDTGTLVKYAVGSKYHPEDNARFKVSIFIPTFFDGDLTIDGTTLDIKTWCLGNANLRLLHLSTDIGNITLHNGTRTEVGSYGEPTIRAKALYANIRQKGSIHLNAPMLAQEYPHDFHTHLETRDGDITFEAVTNMFSTFSFGKNKPWERTDMTNTLNYFDFVTHKGNINFDVQFHQYLRGPWYMGMTKIDARADQGSVLGRMQVGWLVNVFVDLQATQGCNLHLSNNFEGALTVISSTRNATVVPSPKNTHILKDLRPPQRGLKYIFKSSDGKPFGIGTVSLKTTHGDAGLYFDDYNY
ncbi:hypothetical protein BGZ96_011638 [Linnemannia gamsii]|uniref:Adhesin domain-containing protein n=1 Tax=Linnemannia gamsii TaxID=64522 RepID=A0ABQ7JTI5_9FUNG|nr:hypothetical protein BGZ96_011638 [Linnemannia gamsii]